MDETTCTIDEFGPLPVVRPTSPAELGDVVRQAGAAGQAVYPLGGRTMLDLGRPPTRPGVGVDLRGLTKVIDYPARDMTITVQAGITPGRIAEAARRRGTTAADRRSPAGPRHAGRRAGDERQRSAPLGSGTLRDYVIGITTINDEGQETKAGGRVVKNVAGYDMCKLHIGALGTLGIVSQVTLKVRPKPETQALLTFGCSSPALETLLAKLHESRTRPMCLDLLDARAAGVVRQRSSVGLSVQPWVLIVGFEDGEASVNWQIQQLIKEVTAAGVGSVEALAGTAAVPLWQALTEWTLPDNGVLSLKANLLPGRTAQWCQTGAALPEGLMLHAHAGSGIVRGHISTGLTQERAAEMLKGLIDEAFAAGGNCVLSRCPTAWKGRLPVWGRPRNDAWLMRKVKEQLDPRGLFNPGRLL